MKKLSGKATRVTIILGESDQFHHKPLYSEIVERAHRSGIAGATVTRGVEGFGASNHIHTSRVLSLSSDLPVVITLIDGEGDIEAFLPEILELVSEGVITKESVDVILYGGRSS